MRDLPVTVNRVSAEAAAELIVNAAFRHAGQGECHHAECLDVRLSTVRRCAPVTKHPLDGARVRKLRRIADAAKFAVEDMQHTVTCRGQRLRSEFEAFLGGLRFEFAEYVNQSLALAFDLVAMVPVIVGDSHDQFSERRHTVTRCLRKIGTAEEWTLVVRVDEHRQGPAAGTLREQLVRRLVDLVDVRPFLAIDLDIDEQLIHHGCCCLVLERFVRHDSSIGLPVCCARSSASVPHGYQSTGFSACCRR